MPERPLTIATYAVSASLAALLLGYVFGPTLFPDDEGYGASRKKGAVGLSNPANDCFINSVLQSFVGLKSFCNYLEAECEKHSNGVEQGEAVAEKGEREFLNAIRGSRTPATRALKDEVVTRALRDIVNELSEASAYKKTISAGGFVRALEFAFGTHISRKQQDAQEFLHLVAERLCGEFHASRSTGQSEKKDNENKLEFQPIELDKSTEEIFANLRIGITESLPNGNTASIGEQLTHNKNETQRSDQRFPLEGSMESEIECQTCHFKPKPNKSSFVTLTLNVPQKSTTTLDECLDGLLKAEYIDGYKCDRCRIEHALQLNKRQLAQAQSRSSNDAQSLEHQKQLLEQALEEPENPPAAAELLDSKLSPQRRIAKHIRISSYPAVLALHLSRSIFSTSSSSMKNYARVDFPELLTLGVLQRKTYKLASVVTHRGGHNSGHYETYRRRSATARTPAPATEVGDSVERGKSEQIEASSPEMNGLKDQDGTGVYKTGRRKKRSGRDKGDDKWWCISDDKIRACSTDDVLNMQKEAYLLYYELQDK